MAMLESLPAFNAFESQLKTLCLNEFPCGVGSWKQDHKKKKTSLKKTQLESKYSITLKDFGADHEKTETLEELVRLKTSPWNLDYSWSDEAKQLREIAVRSPWLIDESFVLSHFKTLRIADKGVTEVDEDFLKFSNLEELTLSANYLRTVNSRHLPRGLKVLELCANQISNLADLCMSPPPLIHLGLGFNRLYMLEDYITGDYWPCILSLDLSHNNLSDLMEVIRKLQTLPKLRNLTLQGNPLALVPGYRGYTIDSLRKLDFLDEIAISADEKHHYKGLAKRKEYVLDEAKFVFSVDFIRGVPMPPELQNPDDQPEFPIVSKKYFIQFMFLKDSSVTQEIFQMLHDDDDQKSILSQPTEVNTARQSEASAVTGKSGASQGVVSQTEKNVIFAQEVETLQNDTARDDMSQRSGDFFDDNVIIEGINHNMDGEQDMEHQLEDGEEGTQPIITLVTVNSEKSEWAEEMELDWQKVVARDNLLALRDFLKQGMEIRVVEEKILSFPAETEGTPTTDGPKSAAKKDDKKKDKTKQGKDAKKSPSKQPEKPSKLSQITVQPREISYCAQTAKDEKKKKMKPKDDKKKKKKGEPDIDLMHMPAEYTTITTFQIPLEDVLEGEYEFENLFRKNNNGDEGFVTPASFIMEAKKDKKKDKEEKKKEPAGKKKDKDGKKTPDKKGGAKDKKGAAAPPADDLDDTPAPPPPLEVSVGVRLVHWKTAADSLKPDIEEKPKEDEQ